MSLGKLTPLGNRAPNSPKWFWAIEVILLAVEQDRLHKTSRDVAKFWWHKRERRATTVGS
jgi:hypothetical protein